MARPPTTRKVSKRLKGMVFKPRAIPMQELDCLPLELDGLEALRLADFEGLYQTEAAERMGVSRATFARILAAARRAVAEALVRGKALEIGGGKVKRRGQHALRCPIHGQRERRGRTCKCARPRRRPKRKQP